MKHHGLNYIELPVGDLGVAKEFYGEVFGWSFTDYGPEYVEFDSGELKGGFCKGESAGAKGPLVILYSENLEASREAVAGKGVKFTKDIFAFPGGRRFECLDPFGNWLAVWGE